MIEWVNAATNLFKALRLPSDPKARFAAVVTFLLAALWFLKMKVLGQPDQPISNSEFAVFLLFGGGASVVVLLLTHFLLPLVGRRRKQLNTSEASSLHTESEAPSPCVSRPLRDLIEETFEFCAIALGDDYRINLMRLRGSVSASEPEPELGFVAAFRLTDLHRYKGKIRFGKPGAGEALRHQRFVYLGPREVDENIDPKCKHVWSVPVNPTAYVLNIDRTREDGIDEEQKERVRNVAESLAQSVTDGYGYRLDGLPFLKRR